MSEELKTPDYEELSRIYGRGYMTGGKGARGGKFGNGLRAVFEAGVSASTRTPPPPDAGVVEGLAGALRWCVDRNEECLGDHPRLLAKARAALAAYDAAKGKEQ